MLSVGEILKNEREKQGIELSQIEKQIKTRTKFLEAIEENNWDYFSSKIYIMGIIKNYSTFLGLDPKRILAFFRRDYERKEDVKFKRRIASKYLTSGTKKMAALGLGLICILFLSYFSYQLKLYFSPPKIVIISPKSEEKIKDDRIKIVGQTEKDVQVNIFNERIYPNQKGIFEYNFPLKIGKNELLIEVTGANGRKAYLKKTYFRE